MSEPRNATTPVVGITMGVVLSLIIGWLLYIGQGLLVPIVISLLFVYVLGSLDDLLGRWPVTRVLPAWLRRLLLVLASMAVLAGLAALITSTVQQLIRQAPKYQNNLELLFAQITNLVGAERMPDWETIRSSLIGWINIQDWLTSAAGQISSAGGTLFLIIIYIAFLFGERGSFGKKIKVAFPDPKRASRVKEIIGTINERVGQYLGTKTLVNVLLGVVSYVIMLLFGLDYAAFWALLIALLNYIPYVGSIVALVLPVALSMVQFGSWPMTLGLYACLQAVQLYVGNSLEPSVVGRRVNQSPFVVLVALSFWSAIWGIIGAILAVPLTSIIMIVLNEIPATRPLAVLMSETVTEGKPKGRKSRLGKQRKTDAGDSQ